jgi:hypothetical protein
MNVFVDEVGQRLIEMEFQINSVLHVIMLKNQPVGRVQPARLDQVLAQLDAHEVRTANGREGEDRNGHGKLRCDSGLNRRLAFRQTRLLHQHVRERDHLAPHPVSQYLADQLQVFRRQSRSPVMFQRSPDLVETVESRLVQATCLAGHPEQFPAEVDGEGFGFIPILLPV